MDGEIEREILLKKDRIPPQPIKLPINAWYRLYFSSVIVTGKTAMDVYYSEDAINDSMFIQVVGQFYFEKRQALRWQYIQAYMLCSIILTLKYKKILTCKFYTETTLKFRFTANVEYVVLFQLVRQQRQLSCGCSTLQRNH